MDDREQLRLRFNHAFARWGIELPPDAMSPGTVWLIVQEGWTIWTRLDISAADGREHLDYYAMHRMTSDRHVRLYAVGEEKDLPSIGPGYYAIPEGTTVAEQEVLHAKSTSRNKAVEKLLEEKGFVMTNEAHMSARLNRYQQTTNRKGK